MTQSVAARIGIVLLLALGVWKLPGGGKAAAATWDALGAVMLALIAWTAWRFGREHWLDLDRLEEAGRLVVYGTIGIFLLALAGRTLLWSSAPGSILWLCMIGAVGAGAYRSWQLWKEL
ncbi:MAG: hypothetical protein NTX07_09395 [Solirubrobacterales bacterium]|nr:hypothetical protein [Solirubrobacterales bacterium]